VKDSAGREHHRGREFEGLNQKYRVERVDGTGPTGQHVDCRYFVLDLSHDPAARTVALHFAELVQNERPNLAADLRRLVRELRGF